MSIDWKNKEVLVTGGAGFIGSHLANKLVALGANVTIIDNLSQGRMENINKEATFFKYDILDFPKMKEVVSGKDFVFHLASITTSKESSLGWADPTRDLKVNIIGTQNILEAIRESGGGPRFIFASSVAVYGTPRYLPIDENHPTDPISPYGISKLTGEKLCLAYHKEQGIECVILRLASIYGPRQFRMVIYDLIEKIKKSPTNLEVLGSGNQERDFCYVSDVVDAFILTAGSKPDIYNVGSERSTSIRELAALIKSRISPKADTVFGADTWKGDIQKLSPADITKIKGLGFSPQVSLETGLDNFIAWHSGIKAGRNPRE